MTRTKSRIKKELEIVESKQRRKEKQVWKLEDSIKELRGSSEEAQAALNSLNKRVARLSSAFEELLGKNIGRKVIVAKTSF